MVIKHIHPAEKKSRCDIKFVKWFVRKNRALSMPKNDDELNEFIDEVTDGSYNLPCVEVIFKLVNKIPLRHGETRESRK